MPGSRGYTVVAVKDGNTTMYPGVETQALATALGNTLVANHEADSYTVRPSQASDWNDRGSVQN